MPHPIAMIPYANMGPYRALAPPDGCEFRDTFPRDSILALREGRVWAAAAPVGGLADLAGQVDFLGNFGIAARAESQSVLFYSDRPLDQMDRSTTLHVTDQSASSVRLLYLLLGNLNGFQNLPQLAGDGEIANGRLLIGDAALRLNLGGRTEASDDFPVERYPHVTDLAAEWYRAHRLPFVFARWVIRKDAPGEVRHALEGWLERLRENEEELVVRSVKSEAARLGIPEARMLAYQRCIRRVLNAEDLAGQELFLADFERHYREALFESAMVPSTK